MIVRKMPEGKLLCMHQTSHALTAEQFCRHWGNADFAKPRPYSPTILAISQHDNGWYDWELRPKLRDDGYPMDFLRNPDHEGKLNLWRLGISRTSEQHPYAGLLVSRHASLLYQDALASSSYDEHNLQLTKAFLADQDALSVRVRERLRHDSFLGAVLAPDVVDANSRLLQFGDRASLQVSIPWGNDYIHPICPVDWAGTYTAIRMQFDDDCITFDPWPYGVDEFKVHMYGQLLDQRTFADETAYHEALAAARYFRHTWTVHRG